MTVEKQPSPASKHTVRVPETEAGADKPSGLASGLQPGGTIPGQSPGNGMGSVGTGGGSDANRATGAAARESK